MKLYETITKLAWRKHTNRFCLGGHLERRYPNPTITDPEMFAVKCDVTEAVESAICALYPERVSTDRQGWWTEFNDHPATTFDDVLRVLKLADV